MGSSTDHAFDGSQHNLIFTVLVLVSSILASICSALILFLIHKMKLKNGHVLLISTMSWFQLLYDISFFNAVIHVGNSTVYTLANLAQELGGISSSLTSNFIALISLYVVRNTKSIDVYKYYPQILLCVLIPSLIDVGLYSLSCHPKYRYLRDISTMKVYYYIRLVSIAINFVISFKTALHIQKISNRTRGGQRTIHEKAVRTLSMRLIYYPVVQAISRAGCAWYEAQYKFNFDPTNAKQDQFIAQCFVALLTPSASFGYLVIFLLMQPHAYDCLIATLLCRPYIPRYGRTDVTASTATAAVVGSINTGGVSPVVVKINNYSNFASNRGDGGGGSGAVYSSIHNIHDSKMSGVESSLYEEDQSVGADSQSSCNYSFNNKDDDELWTLIGAYDRNDMLREGNEDDRGTMEDGYDYSLSKSLLYVHD